MKAKNTKRSRARNSSRTCEKHKTPLLIRHSRKNGSLAIACPLCDLEQHRIKSQDLQLVVGRIREARTDSEASVKTLEGLQQKGDTQVEKAGNGQPAASKEG